MTDSFRELSRGLAERYTLESELGRGATSVVYRARDCHSGATVAIKVLRPELAESMTADRFLREIRLTEQLIHPSIVPLLGSGIVDGIPYCVFPWMEGGTLRERLERERQLSVEATLEIGCRVAWALDFAHARNLIHRDVKPENILFAGTKAFLGDFGIARGLESAGDLTTSTGIIRGTPAYMSPEQAGGARDYDGRSDIFSLACVLYEALAGVPAYVGPSPQSIAAQRILHSPRPLRIYRPTASQTLETVLDRALSTSPADRYATAGEFAEALQQSQTNVKASVTVRSGRKPRALVVALGLVVPVAIAAAAWGAGALSRDAPTGSLDTTQVIVFRFDAANASDGTTAQEEISHSLARWRGARPADPFQLSEALRGGQPTDEASARRVADRLAIGRYIRGRVSRGREPGSLSIYAALYDVRVGRLSEATAIIRDSGDVEHAYGALADSLLLRGAPADWVGLTATRSLASVQLMAQGARALDEWDLEAADSAYRRAQLFDSTARRPLLLLAQVRQWASKPPVLWLGLVRAAVADTTQLPPLERRVAEALIALGSQDFPKACEVYEKIVARDSASFAGWYGLGECARLDKVVVSDLKSRSGWRFRSSYHHALIGYLRAFELVPATYRGFRGNAYARIRSILLTSRSLITGRTQTQPVKEFWGRVALAGDTIVVVPAPPSDFQLGKSPVDLGDNARASVYLRALFRRVAVSWATAYPRSADAKEAIAVALELQGDAAAVDSLRAAERLSTDRSTSIRLAAERILVQVKFALPSDTKSLVRARASADSLIAAHRKPTAVDAPVLAPLAALIGDCSAAAELLRRGAVPIPISASAEIPASLVADADARLAYTAMGCAPPSGLATIDDIATRAAALGPLDVARRAEQTLLPLIVALSDDASLEWLERLGANQDYVLAARRQSQLGRPDSVRAILARVDSNQRSALAGDVTPDAILPEAMLYLKSRDTSSAVRALDAALTTARNYAPIGAGDASYRVAWVGSLVRSMKLRASLPAASGDPRQWSRAARILWGDRNQK